MTKKEVEHAWRIALVRMMNDNVDHSQDNRSRAEASVDYHFMLIDQMIPWYWNDLDHSKRKEMK